LRGGFWGEYAKLGKRHEDKSVLISTLWKSLVFGLLVFAFHIVEEVVKRMTHGSDLERASSDLRHDQFARRTLAVLCTFIPLFAFREFRRVMGKIRSTRWFLGRRAERPEAARRKSIRPGDGEKIGCQPDECRRPSDWVA